MAVRDNTTQDTIRETIHVNDKGRTVIPSPVRVYLGVRTQNETHLRLAIDRDDESPIHTVVRLDSSGRCTIPKATREVLDIVDEETQLSVAISA